MGWDGFSIGIAAVVAVVLGMAYFRSEYITEKNRVNFRYSLLPPEEKLIYLAEHEMDLGEMGRLVKQARADYQSSTDGISPIMATVRKMPGRKNVNPLRRLKILCQLAQRMPEDELREALNLQDHHGYTALMHAAESSDAEAVRLLLYLGADTSIKNNQGQTASMIGRTDPRIVELMKNKQAAAVSLDPKLSKLLKSYKGSIRN